MDPGLMIDLKPIISQLCKTERTFVLEDIKIEFNIKTL